MQTNARKILVAFAALALAACAGPTSGPSKPSGAGGSTGTGGNGGSTGTGGDGSGGTGGSGGGGTTTGGGGSGGGGGGTGGAGGGGGGGDDETLGCKGYVNCLAAAMSEADAMACDTKAKDDGDEHPRRRRHLRRQLLPRHGRRGGALQAERDRRARCRTSTAPPRSTPPPARPPATAACVCSTVTPLCGATRACPRPTPRATPRRVRSRRWPASTTVDSRAFTPRAMGLYASLRGGQSQGAAHTTRATVRNQHVHNLAPLLMYRGP